MLPVLVAHVDCGLSEATITPEDVTIESHEEYEASDRPGYRPYSFICPKCGAKVINFAPEHKVIMLLRAGAVASSGTVLKGLPTFELSDEARENAAKRLADFLRALGDDELLEAVVRRLKDG